jgi:hypothetical protein
LLQRERRRKVSYLRAATFNGKPGDPGQRRPAIMIQLIFGFLSLLAIGK